MTMGSGDPASATLREGAREIATAEAFRLWVLLAVIDPRALSAGERTLGRAVGRHRSVLRRALVALEAAGYASVDRSSGTSVVTLLRAPKLAGEDRFVRASRAPSRAFGARDGALARRLARVGRGPDPT